MSAEDRDLIAILPLRTPQEARAAFHDRDATFQARYLHALNTVEAFMESHFHIRGDSFQVGFAPPPLGGGDGWLDEGMVPHICEAAEAAGWLTSIEGNFITFTAPPETPGDFGNQELTFTVDAATPEAALETVKDGLTVKQNRSIRDTRIMPLSEMPEIDRV